MIQTGIQRLTSYMFTCLIICGLSTKSHAQNPGYAGQHVIVYGIFEPTINYYTALSRDYAADILSEIYANSLEVNSNFTYSNPIGIGMDVTLGKSTSLGVNFRYINVKMPLNVYYLQVDGESAFDFAYVGETRLKGPVYGIYLKRFAFNKHGSIAPIGRYTKYEFIFGTPESEGYGFVATDEDLVVDYLNTNEIVTDYSLVNVVDSKTLLFRFTVGSQNVYFDKMALDIGLFGTLSIPNMFSFTDLFEIDEAYYTGDAMHNELLVKSLRFGINIQPGIFVF